MKASIKRLAKDQVTLRKSLPPNYLFADEEDSQTLPDDLTQLLICITGPDGTPYSQGLWYLRLDIPLEYPQSPPTATFKTRIFHPNVAEETGAVCLETLKRDWDPKLTLKDILVTISCLLIQPNPDSALNQQAGALIQDDFEAFARQARIMTRIHAPIPSHLIEPANTARRRGEDVGGSGPSRKSGFEESGEKIIPQKENAHDTIDVTATPVSRSQKRGIAQVYDTASRTENLQDIDTRRRKSPKHEVEEESVLCRGSTFDHSKKNSRSSTVADRVKPPDKVVFRASWSLPSIRGTAKARIGIRRL